MFLFYSQAGRTVSQSQTRFTQVLGRRGIAIETHRVSQKTSPTSENRTLLRPVKAAIRERGTSQHVSETTYMRKTSKLFPKELQNSQLTASSSSTVAVTRVVQGDQAVILRDMMKFKSKKEVLAHLTSKNLKSGYLSCAAQEQLLSFFLALEEGAADPVPLRGTSAVSRESIMCTPEFSQFLQSIGPSLASGSAQVVTRIVRHLSQLRGLSAAHSLAAKCAQFAVVRHNAFSPQDFAILVHGLSCFSLQDPEYIRFVQQETAQLIHFFGPKELYLVLDCVGHMEIVERNLITVIVERMADQLKHYTLEDAEKTLKVFAGLGLVRSFVTQELRRLALTDLAQLTPSNAASILTSLARLRFISAADFEKTACSVLLCHRIKLSSKERQSILQCIPVHEVLFASTLVPVKNVNILRPFLRHILDAADATSGANVVMKVLACYVIVFFQLTEFLPSLETLLPHCVLQLPSGYGSLMAVLLELQMWSALESPTVKLEFPQKATSGLRAYAESLQSFYKSLPLVAELKTVLSRMSGFYKLPFECAAMTPVGCVQLLSPDTKIVVELELPQSVTHYGLRHRLLKKAGYHPVCLPLWCWKGLRTEAAQLEFLKESLGPALVEAKVLSGRTLHRTIVRQPFPKRHVKNQRTQEFTWTGNTKVYATAIARKKASLHL